MNLKLIDLDFGGVIANHIPIKCEVVRELFQIEITPDQEATRSILLPQLGGYRYEQMLTELSTRVLKFPIHLGLHDTLSQLYRLGFRFTIVSTQQTATQDTLQKYAQRHSLPIEQIYVTRTDEHKIKIVNSLKFVAFCDDNPPVLDQLNSNQIHLVWANFSRAQIAEQSPYITVVTWDEFRQFATKQLLS